MQDDSDAHSSLRTTQRIGVIVTREIIKVSAARPWNRKEGMYGLFYFNIGLFKDDIFNIIVLISNSMRNKVTFTHQTQIAMSLKCS